MKKALSLALALFLCLGLTVPAFAADGDFVITDNILLGYSGSGGDVVIPNVSAIERWAFYSRSDVTSVVIPGSVTYIGEFAFFNCSGLTNVTIPNGVTSIGDAAFSSCKNLTSVTIPSSMTSIGPRAFSNCINLTSVTLPDGVTPRIEKSTFGLCSSLTSIALPNGVTFIDEGAFDNCQSLTSITIPSSVTSINCLAFYRCINLTDIYYGGTEAQWKNIAIVDSDGKKISAPLIATSDGSIVPAPTVHYNSTQPTAPAQPEKDPQELAYASTQTVTVDGKAVEFQMYALMDGAGNGTNYIKLRDMAQILNGTQAQFSVGYDNASQSISVITGERYTSTGTEMTTPFSGNRQFQGKDQTILVNGRPVSMFVITLVDDQGGGYNYFKLRDLGEALGFNVGWSQEQGVFIETDKPYAG